MNNQSPGWTDDDDPNHPGIDLEEVDFGNFAETHHHSTLPPREWVLGNWWCREFVSSLIGAGAGGKTALRIACALAVAANRGSIVGERVFERIPILYVCFEDGEKELNRRIWAAMIHHQISPADIQGYLWVKSIRKLKLAENSGFGLTMRGPLYKALTTTIKRRSIGMVILDPFIKTHSVNENSNTDMDMVAETLTDLAIEHKVGLDTPHHVRKGGVDPGDPEAARGGSASKDAGRLGYTICGMTGSEAKSFGLDPRDAKNLFRIDAAKVNIAPPADKAKWFRLVSVPLDNTFDPRFPSGDHVQTVELWTPPELFEGIDKPVLAQIFAALRQPPEPDEKWKPDCRSNGTWAGWPICRIANKEKGEAKRIVKIWVGNGVLLPGTYQSPKRKQTVDCLTLSETKAAQMLEGFHQPKGFE